MRVAVDVVVLALDQADDGSQQPVFCAVRRDHPPYEDRWALPGSVVDEAEGLEHAVERVLSDAQPDGAIRHLEQLATFGRLDRDPRGRVISVSYFALIPRPGPVAARVAWQPCLAPPPLGFDHAEILEAAVARLQAKLSYSTVAYGLLPDTFTLSELQAVYEAVLVRPLDKRNFRKKVLSLRLVEETGEVRRGPHRPAQLYRFSRQGLVVLDEVITT